MQVIRETAARMNAVRKAVGTSREIIAVELGVTVDTIGNWERARKNGPPLWGVVGYARYFKVSLAKLLDVTMSDEDLDRLLLHLMADRESEHLGTAGLTIAEFRRELSS